MAEALIFAADVPVRAKEIADVYSEVTGEDRPSDDQIREAVGRLNEAYEESDRTFRIEAWAEGYRMATVSSVAPFLKSYFTREQEQRLSRSLMETLSIIAYKQPVTKPEIDFVRGVDSGYAVNRLLEKAMIDVVGRSESLGRPLLYGTTQFFLDQFGLKDLDALPGLREIEEILDDPAFNKERAQLLELAREDELGGGGGTQTRKTGVGEEADVVGAAGTSGAGDRSDGAIKAGENRSGGGESAADDGDGASKGGGGGGASQGSGGGGASQGSGGDARPEVGGANDKRRPDDARGEASS